MPEAVITAPPAAPSATTPAAPAPFQDSHARLESDLDSILGGSDLGKPESEARVADTKRGHRPARPNPPRAPAVDKPAAGADKTVDQTDATKTTEEAKSAEAATSDSKAGSEAKAEQVKPEAGKGEVKKDPGPWARTHIAERRVKELETKLAEFESRPKSNDPEKLEWVKRHDELDKKYKALDEQVRYIDYTKSSEFQEKHYKPYVEQYQESAAKMMSWRGVSEDGSTPREITAKDFEKFMGISDEDEAEAFASKLLGSDTKTARAMTFRDSIVAAEKNMRKVADEFRKTGVAKQQEQAKIKEAQDKADYEQAVAQWDNLNKGALEKYPDWFTAPDDDEKGKEFLKIGYDNVDKALGAENGMPKEEILARRAAVRNQAGAFRYMVHKWEATKNRVAELEKELAAFKESEPGKGTIAGGKAAPSDDVHASIDASIARLAGR